MTPDLSQLRTLEHPSDIALAIRQIEAAALELHQCAPGARLQEMTHGALLDLEQAAATLETVGEMWGEVGRLYARDDAADLRRRVQREMADA